MWMLMAKGWTSWTHVPILQYLTRKYSELEVSEFFIFQILFIQMDDPDDRSFVQIEEPQNEMNAPLADTNCTYRIAQKIC